MEGELVSFLVGLELVDDGGNGHFQLEIDQVADVVVSGVVPNDLVGSVDGVVGVVDLLLDLGASGVLGLDDNVFQSLQDVSRGNFALGQAGADVNDQVVAGVNVLDLVVVAVVQNCEGLAGDLTGQESSGLGAGHGFQLFHSFGDGLAGGVVSTVSSVGQGLAVFGDSAGEDLIDFIGVAGNGSAGGGGGDFDGDLFGLISCGNSSGQSQDQSQRQDQSKDLRNVLHNNIPFFFLEMVFLCTQRGGLALHQEERWASLLR